jgi:UDP-N-acetylglucosamine 2-epimerase (non-hydrolysing)
MPYTYRSKDNLLREGIQRERIFVIGNPIFEVLEVYNRPIEASDVLARLSVEAGRYFLATLHRAENVDIFSRLEGIFQGLVRVAESYQTPMIISLHPRTADRLARFGLDPQSAWLRLVKPLGFFDFVKLERNARCVLSDSGTVQEECCIFEVPNVTLRDVTERSETLECGSNILTGATPETILAAVQMALDTAPDWMPPREYLQTNVSRTVTKIMLGYHHRLE